MSRWGGQAGNATTDVPRLGQRARYMVTYDTAALLPPPILAQEGEYAWVSTDGIYVFNGTAWVLVAPLSGTFGFQWDYLIDESYTGTAGLALTGITGQTTRLYATITAAFAHAVAAGGNKTFFIGAGIYVETVTATPPGGADWDIEGAGSAVTIWRPTGNGQWCLDLGIGGSNDVRITKIRFDTANFTNSMGILDGGGVRLHIQDCHFTGTQTSSRGLQTINTAVLSVTNCTFDGSIAGINTTLFQLATVTGCLFLGVKGIVIWGNRCNITGNVFICSTRDLEIGNFGSLAVTGNEFSGGGILVISVTTDSLTISGNSFRTTGTSITFNVAGTTCDGLAIIGNAFSNSSTAGVGIALNAQIASGVLSNNTFEGFTSPNEITGSPGVNFQMFHNRTDGATPLADVGNPVGHNPAGFGAGHRIQDEANPGVDLTQRPTLEVQGYFALARDDPIDVETELIIGGESYDAIVDPAPGNKPNHFADVTSALAAGKRNLFLLPGPHAGWTGPAFTAYRVRGPGANLAQVNTAVDLGDQGSVEGITFTGIFFDTSFRFIWNTSPAVLNCFLYQCVITVGRYGNIMNCDIQNCTVTMTDPSIIDACTFHDYSQATAMIAMAANCTIKDCAFTTCLNTTGAHLIMMTSTCVILGCVFQNCLCTPIRMGLDANVVAPVVSGCTFTNTGSSTTSAACYCPGPVDACVVACVVQNPTVSLSAPIFDMDGSRGFVASCEIMTLGSTGYGIKLGANGMAVGNIMKDVDWPYFIQVGFSGQVTIIGGSVFTALKVVTFGGAIAPFVTIAGVSANATSTCFVDFGNVVNAANRTRFSNITYISGSATFAINKVAGEVYTMDGQRRVEFDFDSVPSTDTMTIRVVDHWVSIALQRMMITGGITLPETREADELEMDTPIVAFAPQPADAVDPFGAGLAIDVTVKGLEGPLHGIYYANYAMASPSPFPL